MSTKATGAVKTLAQAAEAIAKLPQSHEYPSAAAMLEAAAPGTTKAVGQRVRGVIRKQGQKVGRGKRYTGITPKEWAGLYKLDQAAVKTTKAAATKKAPAKKVAAKA